MRDVCAFHHTHSGAMDFADKALNAGSYKDALGELLALSVVEIRQTIPAASYKDYGMLLWAVEQASAENFTRAALKDKIVSLGNVSVSIAKLVPGLAAVLG